MARIRTIKPGLLRHHPLFIAEMEEGLPLRLAYVGLWTVADREGRFKWAPEEIKLDCLPYDDVDFSRVLDALATRGFIVKYASAGRQFGHIPSWHEHQFINNRELQSSLPAPTEVIENNEVLVPKPRVGHASATRQGNYKAEGEGEGEREGDKKVYVVSTKTTDIGKEILDHAVELWNQTAIEHNLPQVQKFTGTRKTKLKRRLKDCGGIDGWKAALEKLASIPGLLGGDGDWKADFDFLITESRFVKLMEGKYDGWTGQKSENGFVAIVRGEK